MSNFILDEALRLHALGVSVIPIGQKKKPALPTWKRFQTMPADERQIHDWFDSRDDLGLGIVLGPVSGNLVVRDFDVEAAWMRWANEYPGLVRTLPFVETSRGRHVYARIAGRPSRKFDDGELRSSGNYVVAPPSVHPSGCCYRWGREFDTLASVPVLTVEQSGFDRCWLAPGAQEAVATDRTEIDSVRSVQSVRSVPICGIQPLIDQTLPKAYGSRRKQLFKLACLIRVDSLWKDVPIHDLKSPVRQWHEQALPNIRSKCFDETWSDFVEAYGNVDLSRCGDAAAMAMKRADAKELPPEALKYESPLVRRLVALCAELARNAPDGIFFLSCRKAASVLGGDDYKLANRHLNMLEADRVLQLKERGGPHNNKSNRYRYLPNETESKRK